MRICSSDRDSECRDGLAQRKTWTVLGSISKPWCRGWRFARYQFQSDRTRWKENAAVFEQKDLLDTVLALDADDVVPNDEVVKESETLTVEGEAVDFLEVDADRKD